MNNTTTFHPMDFDYECSENELPVSNNYPVYEMDMEDSPPEPTEDTTKEPTKKIKVYIAASSGSSRTSYFSTIKIDGHKENYSTEGFLRGAGMVYEATLKGILKALKIALDKLEDDTSGLPHEFIVITNVGSIIEGYYNWSKAWKVSGYTNASGKKVKGHKEWKQLLALSDNNTIKLIKTSKSCYISKGCKNKAQQIIAFKR